MRKSKKREKYKKLKGNQMKQRIKRINVIQKNPLRSCGEDFFVKKVEEPENMCYNEKGYMRIARLRFVNTTSFVNTVLLLVFTNFIPL